MASGTVPIRTSAGQAELAARERSLGPRHRTVLFLVDGKREAAEVRRMALLAGVPETGFDELLEIGLIELPPAAEPATRPAPLPVDAPLGLPAAPPPGSAPVEFDPAPGLAADSLLPPSRSLYPSLAADSSLVDPPLLEGWLSSGLPAGGGDPALAEARLILVRAVRAEAPLAGSLTLLRLRRARNRSELAELLDEVEARIAKPHRQLAASQTMQRVRRLLDSAAESAPIVVAPAGFAP